MPLDHRLGAQAIGTTGGREAPAPAARLVIVIPAYNEAATIAALVAACRALPEAPMVIVVDDGSADATAGLADAAGARVLRHACNRGKGAALLTGLRAALAAGARWIVTLDGDGQHRPADIPRLLAAARARPGHIVIGSRRAGGAAMPRARYRANRIADFWISWAARHPIADSQSGLRLYPAALAAALVARPRPAHRFAFESEALIEAGRAGIRTVAVEVPAIYGAGLRASHFRPVADITRIVLMVAGKLLRRGMDPAGLWRSRRLPARHQPAGAATGSSPAPRAASARPRPAG